MRHLIPVVAIVLSIAAIVFVLRVDAKASSAYNNAQELLHANIALDAEVREMKGTLDDLQRRLDTMAQQAQTPPTR